MRWFANLSWRIDGIVLRFWPLFGEGVRPPRGGFWQLGNFDEDPGGANIWANGTDMTPFDRRVRLHSFQPVVQP